MSFLLGVYIYVYFLIVLCITEETCSALFLLNKDDILLTNNAKDT